MLRINGRVDETVDDDRRRLTPVLTYVIASSVPENRSVTARLWAVPVAAALLFC